MDIAARPDRAIADLRALADLTGGPGGARRLCWTSEWDNARRFLRERLSELPVTVDVDEAGNLWARLEGARPETVVIGSHIDSVPNGGWLDGALGVLGALEVLRAIAEAGTPPCTVTLIDFADEEGARFGRSLFGSSWLSRQHQGRRRARPARRRRRHGSPTWSPSTASTSIEPALRGAGLPTCGHTSSCTSSRARCSRAPVSRSGRCSAPSGVERHRVVFHGQAAHSGSTPMPSRRDSFLAAARFALAVRDGAVRHAGVATIGAAECTPGVATVIAGRNVGAARPAPHRRRRARRHARRGKASADEAAAAERCTVEWERIWQIAPIPFDQDLIAAARSACLALSGTDHALPSGPLHDAAEMARVVPAVMIFSSSTNGISHAKEEDTPVEHLDLAIRAYAQTVGYAVDRVAAG